MKEINLKEFPSTRYQGSKRKILPWIYTVFNKLEFETALDAFGGSSSVSYLLKRMNKAVTYNDSLRFNHIIGKAIIENSETKLTDADIQNFLKKNDETKYFDFIEKNFKEIYYLEEENQWLDTVISNILNFENPETDNFEYKKTLAYYSLFQASLIKRPFNLFHRKNLYLRTSDVKRNFGNKTTWDKSFSDYFIRFSNEANSLVFNTGKKCYSKNESAFEIEQTDFDLVYLDPPYYRKDGSNESSNYMMCYHFLEGISQYENWKELIDFSTPNLRFKKEVDADEFSLEKIYENYESLISKFRKSIIILSYKKGGIPSVDFFVKLMKKYKKKVYTKSVHYKYALNHQNGDAKNNREVLIIGV